MNNDYVSYWTGVSSKKPLLSNNSNFNIRCYFDNDSDELINYKGNNGLVNLDVYRQMVKSLKAMGYNAIDIHDQLGRSEFYLWDSYKTYWNYKGDINHINKIIDIIHEEEMLVQIPMYLQWAFNPLDETKECWFEYGDIWKKTWNEYMNSPLGKADIFLLRPRSPIYDVKYRCQCEKCKKAGTGQIMTDVFISIEDIILSKKSDAILICDLYAEGLALFNDNTFKVSEKWLLLYADNGFGKVVLEEQCFPERYKKGIYLHAGFWLNHTVMDPHLTPLAKSVMFSINNQLTDYILVNGQSFKNFILPLEGIMLMCDQGEKFKLDTYYHDWLQRVMNLENEELRTMTIKYLHKLETFHIDMAVRQAYLSEKVDVDRGFQANLIHVVYPLYYQISKKLNPDYKLPEEAFVTRRTEVKWDKKKAEKLVEEAKELYQQVNEIKLRLLDDATASAFTDQFLFPMVLLLAELLLIREQFQYLDNQTTLENVKTAHDALYQLAVAGSGLSGYENWSHPKNSRMHHPIPLFREMISLK